MSTHRQSEPAESSVRNPDDSIEARSLRRRLWWNWLLLSGALVLTTLAFVTVGPTAAGRRLSTLWPWADTDIALIIAYTILIFCLIAYLTHQQRVLSAMSTRFIDLRQQALDYREKQGARLFALFDISRVMEVESEPQTVFDRITSSCVNTFQSDQASLMLLDEEARMLQVRSAHGHLNPKAVLGCTQDVGQGIAGIAAMKRKALIVGGQYGMEQKEGIKLHSRSVSSAMVVPILVRDELVGVLNVSSRNSQVEYDDQDLRAMQVFAANAGAFVRHAEQSQWMRQTIRTLQRTLQSTTAPQGKGPGNTRSSTRSDR